MRILAPAPNAEGHTIASSTPLDKTSNPARPEPRWTIDLFNDHDPVPLHPAGLSLETTRDLWDEYSIHPSAFGAVHCTDLFCAPWSQLRVLDIDLAPVSFSMNENPDINSTFMGFCSTFLASAKNLEVLSVDLSSIPYAYIMRTWAPRPVSLSDPSLLDLSSTCKLSALRTATLNCPKLRLIRLDYTGSIRRKFPVRGKDEQELWAIRRGIDPSTARFGRMTTEKTVKLVRLDLWAGYAEVPVELWPTEIRAMRSAFPGRDPPLACHRFFDENESLI